jgi:hypothetical protein
MESRSRKAFCITATRSQEARGNYTGAAHLLRAHPIYLHRLIRNLDLKKALQSNVSLKNDQGATSDIIM